jgi:PAS domain S-box-containing protein
MSDVPNGNGSNNNSYTKAMSSLDKMEELDKKVELADNILREALNKAPDAILVVNVHGRIVYANDQCPIFLGYTPRQLRGKKVEELMPERYRANHVRYRENYTNHPNLRPMGFNPLGITRPTEIFIQPREGPEISVCASLNSFLTSDKQRFIIVVIKKI